MYERVGWNGGWVDQEGVKEESEAAITCAATIKQESNREGAQKRARRRRPQVHPQVGRDRQRLI